MFWLWVLLLVIFLIFGTNRFRHFGSNIHTMPGPTAYPFVGSALNFIITVDQVIPTVNNLQKKYGSIFLIWFGLIPVVNIITPEGAEAILSSKKNIKKGRAYTMLHPWLGQGLLTSEGGRWFTHRRLITPTFHFAILENFLEIFQDQSQVLVDTLRLKAEAGGPVDIQTDVTRCALDIICEAAMGVKINAQKPGGNSISDSDEVSSQYIKSIFRISQLTTERILNPLIRLSAIFFMTSQGRAYRQHLEIVHGFTKAVIRARKLSTGQSAKRAKRMAFLDLLLEARDQDGEPLSEQDIREEVDTFMFEGHDTTAAAIVWTLYLLGKNPKIQEEIVEEVEDIYADGDRPMTMADLALMKKLERAIKEALRLYPSVPNVTRTITEDIKIGGYDIPEGSAVLLHIYQLHRNPQIFPNPENFDPDRFLPENSSNRHPFAYIPFSAGPRNCIGQKFAMLEEKVILSRILREYQVDFLGDLDVTKIRSELILRPPPGLQFQLRRRKMPNFTKNVDSYS